MRIVYSRSDRKVHATCIFDHGAIARRVPSRVKDQTVEVLIDDNAEKAVRTLELISDSSKSFKLSLEYLFALIAQGSKEFHGATKGGHYKIHVTAVEAQEAVRIIQDICDHSVSFSVSFNHIITKVARTCASANITGSHLKLLAR